MNEVSVGRISRSLIGAVSEPPAKSSVNVARTV
jgi:hypothetical protein